MSFHTKLHRQFVWVGLALVGVGVIPGLVQSATLPPPPSGYFWQFQSSGVHNDSDSFQVSLDVTQTLAPATGSVSNPFSESLSVATFDSLGLESFLEASNPGHDYFVLVTSSLLQGSLVGNGTVILGNFTSSNRTYTGSVQLANWEMSGGLVSGSSTQGLTNGVGIAVSGPSAKSFTDATTSLSTAFQNQSTSDANAATDGTPISVQFDGAFTINVASDNASLPNQLAIGVGSASGQIDLQTTYNSYRLVALPEPNVDNILLAMGMFAMLGGIGIRRRPPCSEAVPPSNE